MDEPAVSEPTARVADADTMLGPAPDVSAADLQARWIGRFAVLRKLGQGGMGAVYVAYDEQLERRVAIKLLHDGDHVRLLREAQALARLSHPHVVQIYEVGEFAGRVFVAMEYVAGLTLHEWLAAAPREADEILDVFVQAGRGLVAAHERGLVHRDFKPGNVIVGDDGRVRVLDFGLARAGEVEPRASPPPGAALDRPSSGGLLSSPLTRTGHMLGTPAYMSPEQFMGAAIDARSDQFSFCAALFEALHGQRPFAGESLSALMASVLTGELRRPPPRPDVGPRIEAAIRRGLSLRPDDRWPHMTELLEVLAAGRGQGLALAEARVRLALGLFVCVCGGALLLAVRLTMNLTPAREPEQSTIFSALLAAIALAGLPLAYRRFRHPRQRLLLHLGLVLVLASLFVRLACWRAGLPMAAIWIGETLVYASTYTCGAAALRAPRVLLTLPILFLSLLLVIEFGAPMGLIPVAWIVTVLLGLYFLQRSQ